MLPLNRRDKVIYPVRMVNDLLPHRAVWDQFPDAIIVASESDVKKHADYEQAKQGNVNDAAPASKRLALAMLTPGSLQAIQKLHFQDSLLVPVHALEGQGFNRIPAGFAELLGDKLGLSVETGVIQVNVVNHTGANGWQRLASPPLFEGQVAPGQRYLLIDELARPYSSPRRDSSGRNLLDWTSRLFQTCTIDANP